MQRAVLVAKVPQPRNLLSPALSMAKSKINVQASTGSGSGYNTSGKAQGRAPWAAAFGLSVTAASALPTRTECEEISAQDGLAESLGMDLDLMELRQVARRASHSSEDKWMQQIRDALTDVARPDGTLGHEELSNAVRQVASNEGHDGIALEMAPLLFRVLDASYADGERRLTLNELLVGQELLCAAMRSGGGGELDDACWHALDTDDNGSLTKEELSVAVRLMVRLGAVEEVDMKEIMASVPQGAADDVLLCAVNYYMSKYDIDNDGAISRDEFSKCNKLQANFRRVLTGKTAAPVFPAHWRK